MNILNQKNIALRSHMGKSIRGWIYPTNVNLSSESKLSLKTLAKGLFLTKQTSYLTWKNSTTFEHFGESNKLKNEERQYGPLRKVLLDSNTWDALVLFGITAADLNK